jgi:hypothetical protein
MALVSPGLEITVTDESQYLPTSISTIPFVLMATSENKTINGVVAPGTTKENAGRIYGISSQRELAATFGYPIFRQSSGGLALHGNELNEYGLMAAYSALGLGNRVWAVRADIDLDQLIGTSIRPTGTVPNNTVWFDIAATSFGIFEYNRDSNNFRKVIPIAIISPTDLVSGTTTPKASIGNIGDYAIVVSDSDNNLYYKNIANAWVAVGSSAWKESFPVVTSNTSTVNLPQGSEFIINGTTITLGSAVNSMAALATVINNATISGISASVNTLGRLELASTGVNCVIASSTVASPLESNLVSIGISNGTYGRSEVSHGTFAQVPNWSVNDTVSRPSGSVWVKTSTQGGGTNFVVKRYNSTLGTWSMLAMPVYADGYAALYGLDPIAGGSGVAAGSGFVKYLPNNDGTVGFKIYSLKTAGQTKAVGSTTPSSTAFTLNDAFNITVSVPGDATASQSYTCTIGGTGPADFVAAILAANIPQITAQVEASGSISITHRFGGIITLTNVTGTPLTVAGFDGNTLNVDADIVGSGTVNITNWAPSIYTYSATEPYTDPATGTLWYYNDPTQVDIMINDTTGWKGYRNVSLDPRGYNLTLTDPNGVIISPSEPTTQSGSTNALVPGDLWLDSSDLENYPRIYRFNKQNGWDLIDNTDRVSQSGIIFADARWDTNGTVDPITGSLVATNVLLTSNYLDLDAPDYRLYPRGTLLFNTRRSGFSVKRFVQNYFNSQSFTGTLPTARSAWVTQQGLKDDGTPAMGSASQRSIIVEALKAAVNANLDLREEGYNFSLLTCPGYPELVSDLVLLNNDRANTGFVIGDTPMTMPANINSITSYNADLPVNDPYVGIYYPSALTFDLSGNEIAVPASHMMLRTFLRNDNLSYPWFAPAGTRRGSVDNAVAIGYVDANSGTFVRTGISQQIRDALYELRLNPISLINGAGIVVYGQKTRMPSVGGGGSAMDRINVARLVNYLRTVLRGVSNQFLFEPNDKMTRDQVKQLVESVLNDLIAKRGLYDYLVVCDTTNNTPDRIARNELYVDVAIEPMKDVEFIYIPIRLKNPGSIAEGS